MREDGASAPFANGFDEALAQFPTGYVEGSFEGQPWGATLRRSADGRRVWLFARALGRNDIVSFNLYRTTRGGGLLKPCEMSSAKVAAFVMGFKPAVK
ncbi:hypothetical protein C8J36_107113 [Rhizobium sp. PP-F2F-G48]|uniref:hypothetical protein n=1 Tax=Rhizobium sp. PP-F2F-G48 TaxID=2135651 RepID=UPI0010486B9D|nr:hypothetical protein [Rhizobium sp. PP-F2F-G48]TCM53151.1 hypothetical protein C8J36_107113 [Rhizobium sp. PP-F2F-G48]